MGLPGRIRPGRDAGRDDRRLFRRRRLAGQRVHGGFCLRHRARQQGSAGLPDGGRRGAEARRICADHRLVMRLFIFILLGAQVDFTLMGRYGLGGVAVVAILMLVARPATVFLCALPDRRARWTMRELLFMCWTRETGVIPAALAGLMLGLKAPGAQMIASVTFIA